MILCRDLCAVDLVEHWLGDLEYVDDSYRYSTRLFAVVGLRRGMKPGVYTRQTGCLTCIIAMRDTLCPDYFLDSQCACALTLLGHDRQFLLGSTAQKRYRVKPRPGQGHEQCGHVR